MTLTQSDLSAIKDLIKITIDEELEEKLEEKLKTFPTKEEFFSRMDEIMGELKTIRENESSTSQIFSHHEDRISKLENKVNLQ